MAPVQPAPCSIEPPRWVGADGPRGANSSVEAGFAGSADPWVVWLENDGAQLAVLDPFGHVVRVPAGSGEAQAVWVAPVDTHFAIVVVTEQRERAQFHRVFTAADGHIVERFVHRRGRDASLGLDAVVTRSHVVLAWDERQPAPSTGAAVVLQSLEIAAVRSAPGPLVAPVVTAITPPEHDASDPVLAVRGDGTLVLAWLAARNIEDVISNATPTDVWVRALSPAGRATGAPQLVSPGPGNRYAAGLLSVGNSMWLTYRVAGDADVESVGDGGSVAVFVLGSDLRPQASPVYVSARDANPSGETVLLPDATGVSVFWTERAGDTLVTWRRTVDVNGLLTRVGRSEPVAEGRLPRAGDAQQPVFLALDASGRIGVARASCPAIVQRVADAGTP